MRLIDADAIENDWFEFHQPTEEEAAEGCMATFRVLLDRRRIDNAPTIDAVPVVRCKDCKHWDEHSQYGYDSENGVYGNYCMLWTPDDDFYAVETPEDGFCYCGERKDDESVDS